MSTINNIGYGFFCFGDEVYYEGVKIKINDIRMVDDHSKIFILTDNPKKFKGYKNIIPYYRSIPSYCDKILLVKHILKKCDIGILIDSDSHIKLKVFKDLLNWDFLDGISYIQTLEDHFIKTKYVKDMKFSKEWDLYFNFIEKEIPLYDQFEMIWEHFLIFNKKSFKIDEFFSWYEKLKIIKEYSDLKNNKKILGAGEGLSIMYSAVLTYNSIKQDKKLKNELGDNIKGISLKYTPLNDRPEWMKKF